jgi:hypothetical protein
MTFMTKLIWTATDQTIWFTPADDLALFQEACRLQNHDAYLTPRPACHFFMMPYGSQWLLQPHPRWNLMICPIESDHKYNLFHMLSVLIFQSFLPLLIFCLLPGSKVYTVRRSRRGWLLHWPVFADAFEASCEIFQGSILQELSINRDHNAQDEWYHSVRP